MLWIRLMRKYAQENGVYMLIGGSEKMICIALNFIDE